MTTFYIISQVFVFIGLVIDLIGRVLNKKKYMLLFFIASFVFYTLSYAFLGSKLATISSVIGIVRGIVYLFMDKKNLAYEWYLIPMIVFNAIFVTCATLMWSGWTDIFLVLSMYLMTIILSFKNMYAIKILLAVNSCFWMFYNFTLHAYVNFACDIAAFVLVIASLIYYDIKRRKKVAQKSESDNLDQASNMEEKKS